MNLDTVLDIKISKNFTYVYCVTLNIGANYMQMSESAVSFLLFQIKVKYKLVYFWDPSWFFISCQ